ncbi:12447_t:CDS:2 [Entrophospora sp. SA101]|nr:2806_t:CDS:2 [Entrophospora sp. SA101]CAJ0848026.1 12447_t:CDS:2 [Entrophospora sp. SA101]
MLSGTFWIFTFKGSADGSQLAAQLVVKVDKSSRAVLKVKVRKSKGRCSAFPSKLASILSLKIVWRRFSLELNREKYWQFWASFRQSAEILGGKFRQYHAGALGAFYLLKGDIEDKKEEYDGENDYGGALFVLKKLLDEWENPPKPALTPEQEEKLKNYDELKKENEKLRNRELTDNEKKIMSEFRRTFPNTGTINARLRTVRRMLNNLERNDLSVEANPNLSAEKISFSQRLAESFEQFTLVCELYLGTERDFSKKLKELRDEIHRLEDKIDELEGERQ